MPNVTFFRKAEEAEIPTKKDRVWVRIEHPGLAKPEVVVTIAKPDIISQFPREFEAFLNEVPQEQTGTSLLDVPGINPGVELELKCRGVRNAESLAELSDMECTYFGSKGRDWRRAAQGLLAVKQNASLQAQIDELKATKRGRPKKDEAA